jgi:hypothetical protein
LEGRPPIDSRRSTRELADLVTLRDKSGCDATDRQIDSLVYQLYGLTDDEIRIVEDATR